MVFFLSFALPWAALGVAKLANVDVSEYDRLQYLQFAAVLEIRLIFFWFDTFVLIVSGYVVQCLDVRT